ncbi:uncharacterized protein LOC114936588 [Nylanderia fulva]|uniref:uncharacterized protein LOC114936588 n=1 Tax=Nylanderia fulva TaxID=613905 RepID=UPI0010FB7A6C|nr:uncharacterized protein LOC114936588 [Nylanderia fulva]
MIVAYIDRDHRDWDRNIADFRFAYNTAEHSSLGTSPAFLNLGRELIPRGRLRDRGNEMAQVDAADPAVWSDRMERLKLIREWVGERLEEAQEKQATYYNLRRRTRSFRTGALVLRRRHVLSSAADNFAAKLAPKFEGPLRIGRKLSSVIYELTRLDGSAAGKSHIQHLKPYYSPDPD